MSPIFTVRFATFAALVLLGAQALAAPPRHVTLDYEVLRNGSVLGDAVETLEHDGKKYSITSEVKGRGILALLPTLRRTSRGRITPQGLKPEEFHDQRGPTWAVSARFDWDAQSLTQERKGKTETVRMPANTQDPLTLAYGFAFAPPAAKEFDVLRADGRGLTPFRFKVVGSEKLKTSLGEMLTLHVEKVRDGPDDKSTDIWFASERNYLPVRVLVVDTDGTRADQILRRIDD
jgi:Protein of unknown function (DUF3108)